MKKIIISVLVCIMMTAFVACGATEDKPLDSTVANEFTTGVVDENATLKVTLK